MQTRAHFLWLLLAPLLVFGIGGCRPRASTTTLPVSAPWLQDVTGQVGINFVHDSGQTPPYFMPQQVGSGAALFDYDNDGRLDLYLLQNGGPNSRSINRLYHQEPNGTFTDVTAGSGLGINGYNMGVAVGDVNNDGLPDVLVCSFNGVRLFLNRGHGHFQDVTKQAGLNDPHWAVSAAFVDYDRDGRLDLVVANYVQYKYRVCTDAAGHPEYCGPLDFTGSVSSLFHNTGPRPGESKNTVHFTDVSQKAGLAAAPTNGLSVTPLDFNGDGWPDLLITQDEEPNRLWINKRDGTFQDEAGLRGLAANNSGIAQANMGIGIADLDGSGLPSVYVTHLTEESNTLWEPVSSGLYQDRTAAAGLSATVWRGTGFGTVMADFDNDGAPDLAVANGRIRRAQYGAAVNAPPAEGGAGPDWTLYAERNQLFAGDGRGCFHDVSAANAPFCGAPNVGRGLACGDIFNDGGSDLLVVPTSGPARLYRDVAANRGHWLDVRAVDPRYGGRDALGAQIAVTAGGRRQFGWINPAYSMEVSNDPRAHFGLGGASRVDVIDVLWPDGKREAFPACPTDQVLTLRRGG